ncbi:MAG TPA: NADH-quinone oxidoreductase subunit D [Mycobacteriales bacterium]|nr:NADH-quinone oxidoreductase subunit D [Mycobacteriales bacterium]
MTTTDNPTASPYTDTTEGRVFTVTGGDWEETLGRGEIGDERIVVNMGPQHPSTHGVLRLVLEIEGESVTDCRLVIGYLHTGIEKSCEYRTWTQATTFLTRCDYLSPFYNECAYVLGVEKLLGIADEIPQRAQVIRVMMMELCRISSHLTWLATGGMEIGALTAMTNGFRDKELVLDIFEMVTGSRMNHAYFRPGGVAIDLPPDAPAKIREFLPYFHKKLDEYDVLVTGTAPVRGRLLDVGHLDAQGALALGVTGPLLRAAGVPWDLRKTMPYCGYETYDFDVAVAQEGDSWARYLVRMREMRESLRIIEQCLDRLEPGPVMVGDKKIGWPAQLSLGADGLGNSLDHIKHIMGTSMEALIHHFKLVTEGFRVPAGQAYTAIESPRGELGCHVVSDGGTRPVRVHLRDPSFVNLQSAPAMCIGTFVADVIVSVASIDPVMGGVDR